MDKLPRLGNRELICLLLFTCNYVVSVWRGYLFLMNVFFALKGSKLVTIIPLLLGAWD